MTRLIDADAFKKYIKDGINGLILPEDKALKAIEVTKGFLKDIDEQPTIERTPGKWLTTSNPNHSPFDNTSEVIYMCSKCTYSSGDRITAYWNFCPNCGAKMISSNSEIEKSKSEIVPDYRDGWRKREGDEK